jgi:hypothetical protein
MFVYHWKVNSNYCKPLEGQQEADRCNMYSLCNNWNGNIFFIFFLMEQNANKIISVNFRWFLFALVRNQNLKVFTTISPDLWIGILSLYKKGLPLKSTSTFLHMNTTPVCTDIHFTKFFASTYCM